MDVISPLNRSTCECLWMRLELVYKTSRTADVPFPITRRCIALPCRCTLNQIIKNKILLWVKWMRRSKIKRIKKKKNTHYYYRVTKRTCSVEEFLSLFLFPSNSVTRISGNNLHCCITRVTLRYGITVLKLQSSWNWVTKSPLRLKQT